MESDVLKGWLLSQLEGQYPNSFNFEYLLARSDEKNLGVTPAEIDVTLQGLINQGRVEVVTKGRSSTQNYRVTGLWPLTPHGQVIDVPPATSPDEPPAEAALPEEPPTIEISQSQTALSGLSGLAAFLSDTTLAQLDRCKRELAVQPLIGDAPYNLQALELRIHQAAMDIAGATLTVGATLLAIKAVEGQDGWEQWWRGSTYPFGRRMAYQYMAVARRVLADQRVLPVINLGVTKAELLLRSIGEEEAQELADHGTIQGRPLDKYDALGRRELEQQLRGLQSERDKATSENQKLKDEMKVRKVAFEDELKEREKRLAEFKQEIAMMKIPHHPTEEQAFKLEIFKKNLMYLEGIFVLCDPENNGYVFQDAPIEKMAEAHSFYQRAYIIVKKGLILFEKVVGYSSEAGMDAACDEFENFRIGSIDKPCPYEEIEMEARAAGEAEKARKNTPPGTLAFKKR